MQALKCSWREPSVVTSRSSSPGPLISRLALHGPVGRGLRFYDAAVGSRRLLLLLRSRGRSPAAGAVHPVDSAGRALRRDAGNRQESRGRLPPGEPRRNHLHRWPSAPTCDERFSARSRRVDFGAHPEANRVQVNIEEWVMPTMAEYRARGAAAVALVARCDVRAHVEEPSVSRRLVSAGVGSPARGAPGGAAAAPAPSSGRALQRSSSRFMAVGESFPGSSRTLLRDPWVPGLPTLAKAFLPLGISRAHRHHPSPLGLRRKPPRARSRISHPTLGVCRVGPSPQPGHERCLLLFTASINSPIRSSSISSSFHPGAPGRSRLVRPPPPRRDDSRRLSPGDAIPPLRDLSRRRFG